MKAFLLAAGLGTRLRPLTDTVPKCLVPIAGRPLLSYWMALLDRHGFDEVLLNVHHLPGAVEQFVADQRSRARITVVHEPTLLGSAGTIRSNRDWITDDQPFLIAYADNLTGANLTALLAAHRQSRLPLTAALFHADEPSRCGIAELAGDGLHRTIVDYQEKPRQPKSSLANAGIYVTDRRILEWIPEELPADFGHDVLPRLVGRMCGHVLSEPLIDIGTWESYARAQHEVVHMGLAELPASGEADS